MALRPPIWYHTHVFLEHSIHQQVPPRGHCLAILGLVMDIHPFNANPEVGGFEYCVWVYVCWVVMSCVGSSGMCLGGCVLHCLFGSIWHICVLDWLPYHVWFLHVELLDRKSRNESPCIRTKYSYRPPCLMCEHWQVCPSPCFFLPVLGCLRPNLDDQSTFPGFSNTISPPVQNSNLLWRWPLRSLPKLLHVSEATLTTPVSACQWKCTTQPTVGTVRAPLCRRTRLRWCWTAPGEPHHQLFHSCTWIQSGCFGLMALTLRSMAEISGLARQYTRSLVVITCLLCSRQF